jgi:hypothetical protein
MRRVSSLLALLLAATTAPAAPPGDLPKAGQGAPRPAMLAGETGEPWPMRLPRAIGIALDNSESVRVVNGPWPPDTITGPDRRDSYPFLIFQPNYKAPLGFADDPPTHAPIPGPLMIERLNAHTPIGRFRADAMALVRSVEQQYWVLAAQRVRAGCAEQVVKTATDVLRKEQEELPHWGRGGAADLAEAAERLEQFQKDLTTQTARLADAERRLREILGLAAADNRRIVPVTRPVDQPYDCAYRDSLPATVRACYERYQKAKRDRIDAARRLAVGKARYDEGRITPVRYFDFIVQHADAVAADADRAAEYNTAIAALGEANGTLLADRFILVLDHPLRIPKNWVDGPDQPGEAVECCPK